MSGLIRFSVGGRMAIHPLLLSSRSESVSTFPSPSVRLEIAQCGRSGFSSRGGWQIWRKGEGGLALYDEGTTSLPVIPLAVTYSGKVSELISNPPLLEIAQINILHGQRSADLQHSLHVAAQPVMYLKAGMTRTTPSVCHPTARFCCPVMRSVYAEPASSAFDSQQAFITELRAADGKSGHIDPVPSDLCR